MVVETAEETRQHLRTSKSWSREYHQQGREASGSRLEIKKEMIVSGEFNDLIPLVPGKLNASKG